MAKILCDDREEEMEENMEQVSDDDLVIDIDDLCLGERHGGQHS